MKAKQKALELYLKFSRYTDSEFTEFHHKYTKECALIVVDEIIETISRFIEGIVLELDYWNEVKKEINNL